MRCKSLNGRFCRLLGAALFLTLATGWSILALAPQATEATALDKKLLDLAKQDSQIIANLTHLSDVIGHRLTGSASLKRANDWTAEKMKSYGLANVQLEPWSLPEGWERGTAIAKMIEPENGRSLTLASLGWYPGTKGKVQGDVVIIKADTIADLARYKGKLKNAIILTGAPAKLTPWNEIEKVAGRPSTPGDGKKKKSFEEIAAFQRERDELLRKEGAAVLLRDSGKHFNLLTTTGGWRGTDRPSASNRLPTLFVAHDHYEMLHRLASRAEPAKTRLEIEVTNKFIAGPIAVYNTVGEIRGSDRPDEFVIVGAHLDSWDLGQGALDNGTGTSVVLETARILAHCGVQPKRTIRFVLFTGEEQGLHGSRAYVQKHKEEMARTTAALVHDTGTGKVLGLGWLGRPALKPILEKELVTLTELGVEVHTRGFGGGSDHASFETAGVPGCIMKQEIAGYRFAHHSQADTLTMANEANLVQGAQVIAVTAMRLANMEKLLPRDKK